jgi:hypothetical protein
MVRKKMFQIMATVLLIAVAAGCKKDAENGIPPTVTSTNAVNKATATGIDSKISVTFSAAMDPSTITTSTFIVKQGTTTVSGTVGMAGLTATFTPAALLLPSTVYTATITTGAKNTAGKSLSADFVWSVTTVAIADTTPPTVTLADPANGATGVRLEAVGANSHPVVITFSEPMDATTLTTATFTLKKGTTLVSGSVTTTSTTATFRPAGNLTSSTLYTATITTGVKDAAGNALASNYTTSFTSSGPPTVVSTTPTDLATCVDVSKPITVTFSEAIDCLTISGSVFFVVQGIPSGKDAAHIPGTITCEGTTVTFTPTTPLLPNTIYTVTITGVKTLAGSTLEHDFIWTFTTTAPTCPTGGGGGAGCPSDIDLKTAGGFGILAGVGISNTGFSEIHDMNVGISPGFRSSITGFPPAKVVNGLIYAADDIAPPGAVASQAQLDLTTAYLVAEGATSPTPVIISADLGGRTLGPGIYKSTSSMLLQSGDLTLDGGVGGCDSTSVWIFQVGSAFTSVGGGGGNVLLIRGAQAKHVFWQVTSSATIGDGTKFKGTMMALTSITVGSGASVEGRMLARNGAVTLSSNNIITKP